MENLGRLVCVFAREPCTPTQNRCRDNQLPLYPSTFLFARYAFLMACLPYRLYIRLSYDRIFSPTLFVARGLSVSTNVPLKYYEYITPAR